MRSAWLRRKYKYAEIGGPGKPLAAPPLKEINRLLSRRLRAGASIISIMRVPDVCVVGYVIVRRGAAEMYRGMAPSVYRLNVTS